MKMLFFIPLTTATTIYKSVVTLHPVPAVTDKTDRYRVTIIEEREAKHLLSLAY